MTATASACLGRGRIAAGSGGIALQCPAGKTLIVKSINLVSHAAESNLCYISVTKATGGPFVLVARGELTTLVPLEWQGWIVLMPDDQMYWNTSFGPVDYWISGSVLSGIADYAVPEFLTTFTASLPGLPT